MSATWKTDVIQKLNADATLRGMVGARIYPAYLADVTNPKFPCVCFYLEAGTKPVAYLSFAVESIRFYSHSQRTYQEAEQIMDRVVAVLNTEIVTGEDGTFVFFFYAKPVEIYDENLRGMTVASTVRRI